MTPAESDIWSACAEQEQIDKIHERIAACAPEIATYPDRVRRFLGNVQRLLVVSNGAEGQRLSSEIAIDAWMIAVHGPLYRRAYAEIAARMVSPVAIVKEPDR